MTASRRLQSPAAHSGSRKPCQQTHRGKPGSSLWAAESTDEFASRRRRDFWRTRPEKHSPEAVAESNSQLPVQDALTSNRSVQRSVQLKASGDGQHLVEGVGLVAGLLERLEQREVEAAVVADVPPHVRQQHDVDKALRLHCI